MRGTQLTAGGWIIIFRNWWLKIQKYHRIKSKADRISGDQMLQSNIRSLMLLSIKPKNIHKTLEICSFSFFSNSYFFTVFSELLLMTDNSRKITWLVGTIFMFFYSLVSLKHLSVWHIYKTTFFGDTFKICLESHEKWKLPGNTQICIFCKNSHFQWRPCELY